MLTLLGKSKSEGELQHVNPKIGITKWEVFKDLLKS
jgi:hypothetical protein